jgi:hypothetical protein
MHYHSHNATGDPHSATFRPTRQGPHSHYHVSSTRSGSSLRVGAPSAAMAELYATGEPSGSRRSAHLEKGPHVASRSSGYVAGEYTPSVASPSSSSPERHIPRQFGNGYRFTYSSSSAHRSHSSTRGPVVDYERDPGHPHCESRSSSRSQPRLDRQPGTASENHGILNPIEYIRAWQDTLQSDISATAPLTKGVVPTGSPALATARPKTRQ